MKATHSSVKAGAAGRMIAGVLGTLLLGTGCGGGVWETDLEAGLTRAAQEGKPALVQFYSAADIDCIDMDLDAFADESVTDQLENYVKIRLDPLIHHETAKQFGITDVPSFVVMRSDRSVAGAHSGKMRPNEFVVFLVRYRFY